MANQVAARLEGDDYQHLTTWLHVLELKMPKRAVRLVTIEDETAGSADDVTIRHESGTSQSDIFFQIKYHVDQRSGYSTEILFERKENGTSILQKLFGTWQMLTKVEPGRNLEIHLVSNWSWTTTDPVGFYIDGRTNEVKGDFLAATPRTKIGRVRDAWCNHVGANAQEFKAFIQAIRFFLGSTCFMERSQRVAERMENLCLKHDEAALHVASGIVRTWIETGRQEVTLEVLDRVLAQHDLNSKGEEACKIVYLTTIKKQSTNLSPDYAIDWRHEFEGDENLKGHAVRDNSVWNDKFLPELHRIEAAIAEETGCRLIRARGLSRLSGWFAFGYVFSEVARYTIEVDQYGKLWRTDADPTSDFTMIMVNGDGECVSGEESTVAVGISISGNIATDVRSYLNEAKVVSNLLLIQSNRGIGRECITSGGDLVAFARGTKTLITAYVRARKAKNVLIFYYGPLSGACFLGHLMNAIGANVQIMEAQTDRSYVPSFLLT